MKKRFKFKTKKISITKIIILLIIGYIIFFYTYQIVFKNKLNSSKLINQVIKRVNNNNTSIDKFKEPEYILKRTLNIFPKQEDIQAINTKENNIIYIYNTHETEEYSDNYLEHYNIIPNIKTMSYILEDLLTKNSINVEVEKQSITKILKDNKWSYNKSYEASRQIIENKINNNNYKLIIDLHRDSSSLDKTTIEYNNKKYARILFVVGQNHKDYMNNYNLSQKLSKKINEIIPDISRGIIKKSGDGVNGIYNQDLNKNMVLIELGGQYNQIEELSNTLEILSKVITNYINEE